MTECSKSTQCAPLKHHYDDCAQRVKAQQSDPDHKGPKEDCVEECKPSFFHLLLNSNPNPHVSTFNGLSTNTDINSFTNHSLPPLPLRNPMRRTQALPPAEIERLTQITNRPLEVPKDRPKTPLSSTPWNLRGWGKYTHTCTAIHQVPTKGDTTRHPVLIVRLICMA